jgi:hypothetical protein
MVILNRNLSVVLWWNGDSGPGIWVSSCGGGMAILDRNLGVLLYLKAKKKNYGNSNISSWQKY